jgi:hypothetical protein
VLLEWFPAGWGLRWSTSRHDDQVTWAISIRQYHGGKRLSIACSLSSMLATSGFSRDVRLSLGCGMGWMSVADSIDLENVPPCQWGQNIQYLCG